MLNPKQQKFAELYAANGNATQAYKDAGYSVSSDAAAKVNASRLLTNANVAAYVDELRAEAAAKAGVTIKRIVDELASVGFANMAAYMKFGDSAEPWLDFSKLTEAQSAVISELTVEDYKEGRGKNARDIRKVKFKLHDKLAALDKLGRHLGMFEERVRQENINFNVTDQPMSADDWEHEFGGPKEDTMGAAARTSTRAH